MTTGADRARIRPMSRAVLAVVALVLVACAPAWRPGGGMPHGGPMHGGATGVPAPDEVAGAPVLVVEAGEMFFRPDRIEIPAGGAVNLRLVNTGAVFHDLTIEELGIRLEADPGDRVTGGILVEEPGTYRLLCTVPGHAQAGMEGELVVG